MILDDFSCHKHSHYTMEQSDDIKVTDKFPNVTRNIHASGNAQIVGIIVCTTYWYCTNEYMYDARIFCIIL